MRQKLRLLDCKGADGGRKCPACAGPVEEGQIVCLKCGWNRREGRNVAEKPAQWAAFQPGQKRQHLALPIAPLLVLAGAAFLAWWFCLRDTPPQEPLAVAAPTESVAVEPIPPPAPAPEVPAIAPQPPLDSEEEIAEVAELFLPDVQAGVVSAHPPVSLEQGVELRRINGQVLSGTIASVGRSNVVLRSAFSTNAIPFTSLDALDRLRCDAEFREAWISIHARAQARMQLVREGRNFPPYRTGLPEAQVETAADLGNPDALCDFGKRSAAASNPDADFGWAFMCFRAAALQDHPEATYHVALFHIEGRGVPRDVQEGLKWMSIAGSLLHAPARDYLARFEQSQAAARVALAAHQERQRVANEQYAARLQAAAAEQAQARALAAQNTPAVPPTAYAGSSGSATAHGRSLAEIARSKGYYVHGEDGSGRQHYYGPGGRHTIVGKRKR